MKPSIAPILELFKRRQQELRAGTQEEYLQGTKEEPTKGLETLYTRYIESYGVKTDRHESESPPFLLIATKTTQAHRQARFGCTE